MKPLSILRLLALSMALSFSVSSLAANNTVQLCGYIEKIGKLYEMEIEKSQKIILVGSEKWTQSFLQRTYKETVSTSGKRLKACASGPYLPDVDIIQGDIVYEFTFFKLNPYYGTIGEAVSESAGKKADEAISMPRRSQRSSGFTVGN